MIPSWDVPPTAETTILSDQPCGCVSTRLGTPILPAEEAALLEVETSGVTVVAEAVFTNVPAVFAWATMVTVARPWPGIAPSDAVILFPVCATVPWLEVAETYPNIPAGKLSRTVTPAAGRAPSLKTVTVYV